MHFVTKYNIFVVEMLPASDIFMVTNLIINTFSDNT